MHLILVVVSLCASVLYCWRYWDYTAPPNGDYISFVVLSSMGLSIWVNGPISFIMILGLISLLMDIIADLYMDTRNLTLPLILFAWGHFFRQIAFTFAFYPQPSIVLLLLTIVLVLAIMLVSVPSPYKYIKNEVVAQIIIYTLIVTATIWNVSISIENRLISSLGLLQGKLSIGLTLFVISDLIIVYELMWDKFTIRQLRVVLVPILFWLAEFGILYELLF